MGCSASDYTAVTSVKCGDRVAIYDPQTNQLCISMPITGDKTTFSNRLRVSNCMADEWKIICCEVNEQQANVVLEPIENTKGLLSGLDYGLANIVTVRNR